jgi:hypothetical protein
MTYISVCGEIEEEPTCVAKGSVYKNREEIFNLLFKTLEPGKNEPFDTTDTGNQGWQKLRYLQGIHQIKNELSVANNPAGQKVLDEIMLHLKLLFKLHCLCIPTPYAGRK